MDDGALIATELVANAAEHSKSRLIRVVVSRPSEMCVRIAVVDRSRTMPALRTATEDEVRGRGLAIVDALATRWGTDCLHWGKRVWGELSCEAVK